MVKFTVSTVFYLILNVCGLCATFEIGEFGWFLEAEERVIRATERYFEEHQKRLDRMKSELDEVYRLHQIASENPDIFKENPIDAFLFMKMITVDWQKYKSAIRNNPVGKEVLKSITAEMLDYEDLVTEDMLEAVLAALLRMLIAYELDVSEFASGRIHGRQIGHRNLTASDCFQIGKFCADYDAFDRAVTWLNEAIARIEKETDSHLLKSRIQEYMAYIIYRRGDLREAVEYIEEIWGSSPKDEKIKRTLANYKLTLRLKEETERSTGADLGEKKISERKLNFTISENYTRLCRGEVLTDWAKTKSLFCFYKNGPSSYLILAPAKAEILHIDPTLVVYHNILHDGEMEVIKELAKPYVTTSSTGKHLISLLRTSRSASLPDFFRPEFENIGKRLEHVTGFDLEDVEIPQVANYIFGGHYVPHHDYFDNLSQENTTSQRLGTILMYIHDVTMGGATVFPKIEVYIPPEKGSAVVWHNLLPNGEKDKITIHGACPVLVGQKWISTRWIPHFSQFRTRPCFTEKNAMWGLTYV